MVHCKAEQDRTLVMKFLKYNDCLHLTSFRGEQSVVIHAAKHMGVQVPIASSKFERVKESV